MKARDVVKQLVKNWIPSLVDALTDKSSKSQLMQLSQNQAQIKDVFQQIRRKNMRELVPNEYKKRNDFAV